MSLNALIEELGGVARRSDLVRMTSRVEVDRALRAGSLVAVGRGRYCLPTTQTAVQLAHAIGGVLSHSSAALHHGWEVKQTPERPHITVPRRRRVDPLLAAQATLHYVDLDDEWAGIATSVETTLLQSLRGLPPDEGPCIADSALRHGVPPNVLRRVAMSVRGPGSAQVRLLAASARGEAANPFESCLRWIADGVDGLQVEPQVWLAGIGRPDLVDSDLGIVLEADSFAWHGDRAALKRDARRYNLMVEHGWIVLRFAWEDVMFDQDYVRLVLTTVVALVHTRAQPCCAHRCAA